MLKCRIEAESGRPPSPQINAAGARARALLAARLAKSATPDEIGFGPPDPPRGGGVTVFYILYVATSRLPQVFAKITSIRGGRDPAENQGKPPGRPART